MDSQSMFEPAPFGKTSGTRHTLANLKSDATWEQVEELKAACREGSVVNVRRCLTPLRQKLAKMRQLPDIIRSVYDGRVSSSTKRHLLRILLGYDENGHYYGADALVRIFLAIIIKARNRSQEINDADDDTDEDDEVALAIDEMDNADSEWSQWAVDQIISFEPQLMTYRVVGLPIPARTTLLEHAINNGDAWVVPDYAKNADWFNANCLDELFRALSEKSILETAVGITGRAGLKLLKKLIGACKLIENTSIHSKLPETKLATLLQAIIESGNLRMLRYLNEQYPEVLTLSHEDKTALQMLKSTSSDDERRSEMERYIKAEILALHDTPLSKIRTLLGTEHELYLDLTQFDWEQAALNAFITRMKSLPIRLQEVLLHVHLPELVMRGSYDDTSSHEENQQSRTEAKDILDWLKKNFKVNSIIELVVKDNLHDPHWEEVIEECLLPFSKIERLNWRKIDLSMKSISAAKSLRELWLYSSGNSNSIAHWLGAEGLVSLPNLRKVHLVFVKGLMTNEHSKKCVKYAEELIRKLGQNDFDVDIVDRQGWPRQVLSVNRRTNPHHDRSPAQMLNLEKFLSTYRTIRFRRDRAVIKVAIIDTGIDLTDETLASVVEKGVSFYQSDAGRKESPWYLPMDPHGSQMARIILDLCHDVRLYIAKVATDRRSIIRQEDVQKAMEWAASENVDIINMSMVIRDERSRRRDLEEAVKKAKFALIGSTLDHGSYNPKSCFPCPNTDVYDANEIHKTDVITIAACDHLGTPLPTANRDAAFHFFGDRMAVKSVGSIDEVSGSSVATAVATGVAALSLGLNRYAHPEDDRNPKIIIRKTFNQMKIDDQNSKYVSPGSYFTPAPSSNAQEQTQAWTDTRMVDWAKHAI